MTAPPAGALEACPFCGERIDVVSNRDWHRLAGEHAEWCPLADYEFATPATDDDLAAAIAAWNRRTYSPALLAALRLREWRPIAEAPKDGRSVLIFCKDAVIPAIAFFCEDAGSWMSIAGESFAHPIMWVPAPIPTADDLARVLEESAPPSAAP